MKKGKLSPELKVGLLILLGITLLFYMSIKIERFGALKEKGYEIYVYLDNASGIDARSPVQVAGVTVGQVRRVTLEGFKAKIVMLIREDVKIPKDSIVALRTEGVLGDKYIEIIPGKEKTFLGPYGVIEYVDISPSLEEMLKKIDRAASNFGDVMGDLKGLVGEREKMNLKESLKNIRSATAEFSELISKNRESVARVISNADEAVSGLKKMVQDVEEGKGTLGLLIKDDSVYKEAKELITEAKETLGSIKNIAKDVEEGKGTLGKFLKDESMYVETKETVRNLKEIAEYVNRGEGTLGKLTKDETLYKETKKAIKGIQRASDGIQEMTPITVLGTLLGILF
ncbi:MAG: MlaD family protein [Desulfobacterota bacterium]|nr:MlaD family protein [Thermodesulfobacteriota bacterium]MDW8001107.1 MlaD family protein [Deltaproteobacteria bacterium]